MLRCHVETARRQHASSAEGLTSADAVLSRLDSKLCQQEAEIASAKSSLGRQFPDEEFWCRPHDELQIAAPWLTAETQRMRERCFSAALELHRAFIDAAAKPIRNNLNMLFGILMGEGLDEATTRLLPSLWSTLFLTVLSYRQRLPLECSVPCRPSRLGGFSPTRRAKRYLRRRSGPSRGRAALSLLAILSRLNPS
jgi:hypothetical protein